MTNLDPFFSSNKDDWETPQELFQELDNRYKFTLDAASCDENAKCEKYFTIQNSGLDQSWSGERVFCNPPYGRQIGKWVKKCANENEAFICLLIPARTDTSYFHDYIYKKPNVRIEFLRGRLKFEQQGIAMKGLQWVMLLFRQCLSFSMKIYYRR